MSKPSRKYWIWKHQPGQDAQEADCIELINRALKLNCTLMQQEYGIQEQRSVTTNWNRVQQIKEGDIIFLVGKQAIYAYGEVIKPRLKPDVCLSMKEIIESRNHTHDEATYSSDCFKGVIHFKDNPVFYENLEEEDNWGQRIDVDSWKFFSEKTSITYSRDEINKGGYPESMSDVVEEAALRFIKNLQQNFIKKELRLLFENKNIILHGAPGTGKTFQTKNIATELIFSKPKGHLSELEQDSLKKQYQMVQFHPSYDYTDFVEGLRPIKKGENREIGFERKDGVFKAFCKKALRAYNAAENKENAPKFVFVIDEINRGDMSKIFGELFFSIDPGYRGSEGKIKTQYANLNDEPNEFDKALGITDRNDYGHFFVPKNVYVIGTMNDIDRSVESMDFAMRRRFTFCEITAKESATAMGIKDEKYNAMNNTIAEILGKDYQIGGAYLLDEDGKPHDLNNSDIRQKVWQHRICPLVKEYLRGIDNDGEKIKKIASAFGVE